jgi:valyl-tRNA synthetase
LTEPRIITGPVRLTGSVHPQQLSSLVAADVLVRRMAAISGQAPAWELISIAGDIATQHAAQRAVVREGDNRQELGKQAFAERAERLHQEAQINVRELLGELRISTNSERWAAGADEARRAARIAFVRLYEEGLLSRTDAVIDSCPSCETVLDEADVDVVDHEVERIRLRLPTDSASVEVEVVEPELLVGAVALAVPVDLAPDEQSIYLPVLDDEVPIVSVDGLDTVEVVVPGHYKWSHELARQLGLSVPEVIDSEGIVRHDGPLNGLGRYAARVAASEQLAAGGYVAAHFPSTETSRRCHRCGTVLVPLRGRHWLLHFPALTQPVVEKVTNGELKFSPAAASETFVGLAQTSGTWCVSQQLWSGQQIPVFTCLDCSQTTVSVDMADSCPSCMGTLAQDDDVLDARFVAAVVPLVMHGWPKGSTSDAAASTTLSIGRLGLQSWALPMSALGLRLGGSVPFSEIVVHQFAVGAPEPGQRRNRELIEMVRSNGFELARIALLIGDLDMERAQETLAALQSPDVVDSTVDAFDFTDAFDNAVSNFDAGEALSVLVAAAKNGISDRSKSDFEAMAGALLGVDGEQ